MDFYSLVEFSQLKAIHAALEPSIDSIYRLKCREYSIKFHTPLHVVVNELDPVFILQSLYEDQYHPSIVEDELEELLERLRTIQDPTYSKMSQEDVEDLVDHVMNKEIKRMGLSKKPKEVKKEEPKEKTVAKSGSMDFSSLQRSESDSESGKGNF